MTFSQVVSGLAMLVKSFANPSQLCGQLVVSSLVIRKYFAGVDACRTTLGSALPTPIAIELKYVAALLTEPRRPFRPRRTRTDRTACIKNPAGLHRRGFDSQQ